MHPIPRRIARRRSGWVYLREPTLEQRVVELRADHRRRVSRLDSLRAMTWADRSRQWLRWSRNRVVLAACMTSLACVVAAAPAEWIPAVPALLCGVFAFCHLLMSEED